MRPCSRVILLMALLAVTSFAGWWPFKGEEKKPRRGRRQESYEEDQVEQEWEVDSGGYQQEEPPKKERRRPPPRKESQPTGQRNRSRKPKNRDEMEDKTVMNEILQDDAVEETETFEDDGYLSDDEIHKLWTQHMHDFVPEDMINTIVEKNQVEALYEYIGHETPTTIKGAYYVYGGNQEKAISCVVYGPNREILYKRKGSPQGILIFQTTVPGEYSVVFSNFQSGQDLIITLALHTFEEQEQQVEYDLTDDGQRVMRNDPEDNPFEGEQGRTVSEEERAASDDDIGNVRSMLRDIQVKAKQIQSEAKMSLLRQNGHNEALLENASWNFYASLLELMAFGGILAFQTHHIKKCLDNKLIL